MKKIFVYASVVTSMIFLSLTAKAQQSTAVKAPEMKAEKLQPVAEVKMPVVSPAPDDKTLPNTATAVSSAGTEVKLVKAVDNKPPAQLPPAAQPAQTDKLGLPKKSNN